MSRTAGGFGSEPWGEMNRQDRFDDQVSRHEQEGHDHTTPEGFHDNCEACHHYKNEDEQDAFTNSDEYREYRKADPETQKKTMDRWNQEEQEQRNSSKMYITADEDFDGYDLQGTGREITEPVDELGNYLYVGDQPGKVFEDFPNFENENNEDTHDDSHGGGSFSGDHEIQASRKTSTLKVSTVQHLEPGHFYKAHFDCNCGEKHEPYDGRVTVKEVDHAPGGERATVSSAKLGDFEVYGFGDVKAPYSWCYGADADPVSFAHIMGPKGEGGGQMGQGGMGVQAPPVGQQPGVPQQAQPTASRKRAQNVTDYYGTGHRDGMADRDDQLPKKTRAMKPSETIPDYRIGYEDGYSGKPPRSSSRKRASDPFTLDSGNAVIEPQKTNNELDPASMTGQGSLTLESRDPHGGEDAAMPPTQQDYQEGLSTVGSIVRQARRELSDGSWFNGTAESIYDQLERLQELAENVQRTASRNLDEGDLQKVASIHTELRSQIDGLQRVALEYVDFDTDEYLRSLPGGTVASDYGMRLIEAGTQDLGEDDGSFLYREAKKIQDEIEHYDWNDFSKVASELWVLDQGEKLLSSELATREASIMYAQKKTLPVLNVEKRAAIIDSFVTAVEYNRRQVNSNLASIRSNTRGKVASRGSDNTVSDIMGDTLSF